MIPCRCRWCGRRRNLHRPPDDYLRHRRCHCKGERRAVKEAKSQGIFLPQSYRVDTYRNSGAEKKKQGRCWCDGYSFPHRPRSLYCHKNPNLTTEMLEERMAWA